MNVQFSPTMFAHFPSYRRNIKAWLPNALPSTRAVLSKTAKLLEINLLRCETSAKGDAAYLEFLREMHLTAKEKEATIGSACPFFQTKGRCPFAKDTSGKPILSPDFIVVCVYFLSHLRFRRK